MTKHGYDLSLDLIRRLLTKQAFGTKPLKLRMHRKPIPAYERMVLAVELDLTEEESETENLSGEFISIRVGSRTFEFSAGTEAEIILKRSNVIACHFRQFLSAVSTKNLSVRRHLNFEGISLLRH